MATLPLFFNELCIRRRRMLPRLYEPYPLVRVLFFPTKMTETIKKLSPNKETERLGILCLHSIVPFSEMHKGLILDLLNTMDGSMSLKSLLQFSSVKSCKRVRTQSTLIKTKATNKQKMPKPLRCSL